MIFNKCAHLGVKWGGGMWCNRFDGEVSTCEDCNGYTATYTKEQLKEVFDRLLTHHGNLEKMFFDTLTEVASERTEYIDIPQEADK